MGAWLVACRDGYADDDVDENGMVLCHPRENKVWSTCLEIWWHTDPRFDHFGKRVELHHFVSGYP